MAQNSHFFIGIPVNQDLKEKLSDWQNDIKEKFGSNYQIWTYKEDLHITLKFLGEADRKSIEELQHVLRRQVDMEAFSLEIGGIGTFGKPRKPRVLWAGVKKTEAMENLKDQIESAAAKAGFLEDNQPYRPHITLAKKWKGEKLSKEVLESFSEQFNELMTMDVTSFSLFRIHPSKKPKYEEVIQIELK